MELNELTNKIFFHIESYPDNFAEKFMAKLIGHDIENWVDYLEEMGFNDRASLIREEIRNGRGGILSPNILFFLELMVVHWDEFANKFEAYEKFEWSEHPERWNEKMKDDIMLWAQYIIYNDDRIEFFNKWMKQNAW